MSDSLLPHHEELIRVSTISPELLALGFKRTDLEQLIVERLAPKEEEHGQEQ